MQMHATLPLWLSLICFIHSTICTKQTQSTEHLFLESVSDLVSYVQQQPRGQKEHDGMKRYHDLLWQKLMETVYPNHQLTGHTGRCGRGLYHDEVIKALIVDKQNVHNIMDYGPGFHTEYVFTIFHPHCCSVVRTKSIQWVELYACDHNEQMRLIQYYSNHTLLY